MAFEDAIAVMRNVPLLGLLETDALRILAFSADTRQLKSGEILFRRGERSDGAYVVVSGAVAVGRGKAQEDDRNVMRVGGLIGRTALFVRTQRPATAVAIERSSVLRISPTLMRRVLQEFPTATAEIRRTLAADLGDLSTRLATIGRSLEALDAPRPPRP